MPLSNAELLEKASSVQKAILTTADFGGAGEAILSEELSREFMRIAIVPQDLLPDVRVVSSRSSLWTENKIDFSSRILRPGVEGERLTYENRVKPTTGLIQISTVLVRGEVPVSDESMEDLSDTDFDDAMVAQIAEATGRDLEELFISGDVLSGDSYLAQIDGWLKQAEAGHVYAAAGDAKDYQTIFKKMIQLLPDKYKRNLPDWRFIVPRRLVEEYRDILAARGTPLGDLSLEGGRDLVYQQIKIQGVAQIPIAAGSPDTSKILLTHRLNLIAGYRRRITMEEFRDPREGQTSHIVTARVDAKISHVDATVLATGVNVEP